MLVLPADMLDIPDMRRDTSKPENIRWLLRNLGVRNSAHPKFDEIVKDLIKLSRKSS